MKSIIYFLLTLCGLIVVPRADIAAAVKTSLEKNVILITFDGVRPQEFLEAKNMPWFWSELSSLGNLFSPKHTIQMAVSNKMLISLPAYQSLMAGVVTDCESNDCGRIKTETFPERLVRELKLPKDKVATIASWNEIAHEGNYAAHLQALGAYDVWLRQLREEILNIPDYGENTSLLITTDHGRGTDSQWPNHGPGQPEARSIWLFGLPTAKGSASATHEYSHIDIRPTIEALLGLEPVRCAECGHVIQDLIPLAHGPALKVTP